MVGPVRRFPLRGLALIALGFLLASALSGGGAAVGAATGFLLFLPLLALKLLFLFFLFGAVLSFAGGGWGRGPWHHRRPYGGRRRGYGRGGDDGARWWYKGQPMSPSAPARNPEEQEWEETLRQARREVDDLDAPYRADPDHPTGPRPPRPSGT